AEVPPVQGRAVDGLELLLLGEVHDDGRDGRLAATLTAGDRGDILIAGDTAYDQQPGMAALAAVMAGWTRTDQSYATRVRVLTQGGVVPRLSAATVHSNGGGNVLHDPSGLDWLFVLVGSDRYTRTATEQLVRL